MAEVIAALGIIASVAQLADYGFKLSLKLYTFSTTVSSADESIKGISNDVSLTSTVLNELCSIIKSDDTKVVSPNALSATEQTVKECLSVFNQLDSALDKSLANLGVVDAGTGKKPKKGTVTLERLKWPFKQPKMELLRSNLDRLKASLTLMLQVLQYARDVSNRKEAQSSLAYQQALIESLALSEKRLRKRYLTLQNAVQSSEPELEKGFSTDSVNITNLHITNPGPLPPHQTQAPSQNIDPSASAAATRVIKMLLSFQILNDTLVQQLPSLDLSTQNYGTLRSTVSKIKMSEVKRLEATYGSSWGDIRAEAARKMPSNLSTQDLESEPPKSEDDPVSPSYSPASESIAPPYYSLVFETEGQIIVSAPPAGPQPVPTTNYMDTVEVIQSPSNRTYASSPYDPYDPDQRTSRIQAEIDDTVGVMRENINRFSQRGERLDALTDKTDELAVSAQGFRRGANRVRKQTLWRDIYDNTVGSGSSVVNAGVRAGSSGWEAVREGLGFGEGEEEDWVKEGDEDEDDGGDVLSGLLRQWTNLPPSGGESVDEDEMTGEDVVKIIEVGAS